MGEFDITDTLIQYLDGELDPVQRRELEERLQREPELAEQLEVLRMAVDTVQYSGTAEKVKQIHRELAPKVTVDKPGAAKLISLFSRRSMALAASLIIGISMLGGWWFYTTQPDQIFNDNYVEFSVSQNRGNERSSKLSDLFVQKKYDEMMASSATALNAEDSILVSIAFLHSKKYEQAERWLGAVQQNSKDHKEDADYYLAFTYLAQKRYDRSYELFKTIHDDPAHLYHNSVSGSLLRKLAFKR